MTFRQLLAFGLAHVLCSSVLLAQNGDRPGEEQPDLPADLNIPAAPALSVEEALKSFEIAPGYRIEAIAAEPLVQDPVCMAFDGDGQLWVAEMIAYMPNVDGTGEDEPTGRIAVLRDTDGDGIFDSRKNFLEDLVLPRAVLPYKDGALVIVPPELSFYRDTNGDGLADSKHVIAKGLGGLHSPEHAINSLRWTLDNWIQCANHPLRFRETEDGWITQRTSSGGQWGLAFDEIGRAFFNTNSDGLRGDEYSSHYAVRNTNFGTANGVNVRFARDQTTWPARITPGVNRGYRPETLRDDFKLRNFTGACGPLVYLGANLPADVHGNAFVAEPCGNLVKRYTLHESGDLGLEARNAYEGREFLASTDERFRPVNLYDGPDGALYIVDMYRGLIQHRLFVTSFLRKQVLDRKLEEPIGMGRLWRVTHEDSKPYDAPKFSEANWNDLVDALDHPNGWWRLTAQRLIVEEGRGDSDAIELCREAVWEAKTALGRCHALWALEGIGALDEASLLLGLSDEDERVVHTAVRCSELLLSTGNEAILAELRRISEAANPRLLRQIALSLGEANTKGADVLLLELMLSDASSQAMRSAVLSGIGGREFSFLTLLTPHLYMANERPGLGELLKELVRCATIEGRHETLDALVDHWIGLEVRKEWGLERDNAWQILAVTEGMLAGRPKSGTGEFRPIQLSSKPSILAAVSGGSPQSEKEWGEHEFLQWITWPGGPNSDAEPIRALTAEEQLQFDHGRQIYADVCAACHQGSGRGAGGLAPSLRYSPWLLADKKTPIRILLGGLTGPIEVEGKTWNLEMPVYDTSHDDVAAVLTYTRREWGHGAEPITAAEVAAIAEEMEKRTNVWTAEELEAARAE